MPGTHEFAMAVAQTRKARLIYLRAGENPATDEPEFASLAFDENVGLGPDWNHVSKQLGLNFNLQLSRKQFHRSRKLCRRNNWPVVRRSKS